MVDGVSTTARIFLRTPCGDSGVMRIPGLAALVVLALLVAGCASEPAAPAAVPEEPLLVTEANDAESLTDEAFRMQAHQHDYWGGAERLTVLEATRPDQTFFVAPFWGVTLVPEPGQVVPQGTSRVEVTVSWTDGTAKHYTAPELWVRTAADHEPVLVGPVEQGQTLVLDATLAHADLPHQTLSAWRFEWRIRPGPGSLIWWDGEVNMKAVAVRGLEIPVYPPHPDLWDGAESRDLLDGGQSFGFWRGDPVDGGNCYGQCPEIHRPGDGLVVPYDATTVEVVFEQSSESVTEMGLRFHAADTREFTVLEPAETQGAARVYRIPVTTGMGDSPYATQSLWEFAPFVQDATHSLKTGSYTLTARVLREA